MVELRLSELAQKMEGTILQGNPSDCFSRFNIDSRLTHTGELFFALKAKRDGHDFIHHAIQKGAGGIVISQKITPPDSPTAFIQVNETLTALQTLAQKVLIDLKAKVVGITGSVGKTTAKEFLFSLLSGHYQVLKSEGNFNNHIGLPLSILRLSKHHEIAVLEYGMSTPGEIKALTQIAPPDIAVITNVNPVHLEFLQNLREIALAKKEIIDGMKPDGTAVLNGDDDLIRDISRSWKGKKIFFGNSKDCLIRASHIQKNGWEGMTFKLWYGKQSRQATLPFFTQGYLYNFLAAVGVAYEFGIPADNILKQALTLKAFDNRGTVFLLKDNIKLIDDSYNSNPAALTDALESLAELPGGRKVAILGDMLELGKASEKFHVEAGSKAAYLGLDLLITVGALSRHMAESALASGMGNSQIYSFEDSIEAAQNIRSLIQAKDVILVKGSRGIRMEEIVNVLKQMR